MSKNILVQSNAVEETRQLVKIASIILKTEHAAFGGVGAVLWRLEVLPIHDITLFYWGPDVPEAVAGVYEQLGVKAVWGDKWGDRTVLVLQTASGYKLNMRFSQQSRVLEKRCSKVFYTGHKFDYSQGIRVVSWDIMTCSVLTEIAKNGPTCFNVAALIDLWEHAYGDEVTMKATIAHFVRTYGIQKLEPPLRKEVEKSKNYEPLGRCVDIGRLIQGLLWIERFTIEEEVTPRTSPMEVEVRISVSMVLDEFGAGEPDEFSLSKIDLADELTNTFGDEDML